jgi:hypothetical protein
VLAVVIARYGKLGLADSRDVLVALIGFSSHGGLVATERAFNEESVNGDLVSDLEFNEVSDEEFVRVGIVVGHTISGE